MGLSSDPAKKAKQLANLQKGGLVAAQRHGTAVVEDVVVEVDQPDSASAIALAPEPAGRPGLPVVGYGNEQPASASPAPTPPSSGHGVGTERRPPEAPARAPEPNLEDEDQELEQLNIDEPTNRGGLGGVLDGFLGR